MNQITSCQAKAISLNNILTNSSVQLPVYTRFQKADQYLTVPVTSVDVSEQGIQVHTTDGMSVQIAWEDLVDVVAFVDGKGKPVFLTEISNGGNVAADYIEEVNKGEATLLSIAVDLQDVYLDRFLSREEMRWRSKYHPKENQFKLAA